MSKDTDRALRVLITGADGFIGKNLRVRLGEKSNFVIHTFVRETSIDQLANLISDTDLLCIWREKTAERSH